MRKLTIKLQPGQKLGFTSDLHLYHDRIIELANRPYSSEQEMNETLRDTHNNTFGPNDIIINLGDAILLPKENKTPDSEILELLKSFNGKIYYVPGNHERKLELIKRCWTLLDRLTDLVVTRPNEDGQHIVLCHYPLRSWNRAHKGSWHLHGHCHNQLKDDNGLSFKEVTKGKFIDIGIDTNQQKPYTYEDIEQIMALRTYEKLD